MPFKFSGTIVSETLKGALSSVVAVVDEGKVQITKDGFAIKAVDAANVGMVSLELGSQVFKRYEFETPSGDDAEEKIGVDLARLSQMLQATKSEDIEVRIDQSKMHLDSGGYGYTLSLLDLDGLRREPKVPDLDYHAKVQLYPEFLQQALRAISKLGSDSVDIGTDTEKGILYLLADNGMGDSLRVELKKEGHITSFESTTDGSVSRYTLQYLTPMAKGFGHATEIMVQLRTDYPLSISFNLGLEHCTVAYLLAPRIEGE